jgi:hypothetical protein
LRREDYANCGKNQRDALLVLAAFLADTDLSAGGRFAAPLCPEAERDDAERFAEAFFDWRDKACGEAVDVGSRFSTLSRVCDLFAEGFRPGDS